MNRPAQNLAESRWPCGMAAAVWMACVAWAAVSSAQVAIPPAAGPEGRPAAEVVGRIIKINDRQITVELTTPDKRRVKFMVPLAAEVVLNKREAMLDDLRPADFVRITISPADAKVAQRVLAARVVADPKSPAAGEPPADLVPAAADAGRDGAGMGVMVVSTPGSGLLVTAVQPRGPAQRAGIRPGDFLMMLDGEKLTSPQMFVKQIAQAKVGSVVAVSLWREGRMPQEVPVTLGSAAVSPDAVGLPGPQAGAGQEPAAGANVNPANVALPSALAGGGAVAGDMQAMTQTQLLRELLVEIRALRQELRAAKGANAARPPAAGHLKTGALPTDQTID